MVATRLATVAGVSALLIGTVACDGASSDDSNSVGPAAAYTAIVEWQVGDQEPVVDDNGKVVTPVVFLAAQDGATIDAGVQAAVAEATSDWATVRFADQPGEAFDPDIEGEPVREDGVMLSVGPLPEAARSIDVSVMRFIAVEDFEEFLVEITATPNPANTSAVSPKAAVSSASTVPQP